MPTHFQTHPASRTAAIHTASAPPRLDALTSLRFVAAAMIVVDHVKPFAGHGLGWADALPLAHGVSFFFVLSGFILTYTYPRLKTHGAILRFWIARFARVWPVHAVTAVVALAIMAPPAASSDVASAAVVMANLLLVQTWVPIMSVGYSLNGASWSVSVEMFFYLLFPFLVLDWRQTWHRKLGLSLMLLVAVVACGNSAHGIQDTLSDQQATTHAMAYLSPFARLFEFTLGMASYMLWRRLDEWESWTPVVATVAEFGAIGLTVYWLTNQPVLALAQTVGGPTGVEWARYAGTAVVFALLVPVMATNTGAISWLLAFPGLVVLGESSYSLYLWHSMLLTLVDHLFPGALAGLTLAGWAALWALLVGVALLSWAVVELPARQWILHTWDTRNADSGAIVLPAPGQPFRPSA